ncbi:unnamed protein product [Didymodactylos carnosus]|uniref:Uncharacterized protein n=1 Tax=Didymodactylos carnosus TaxID=1234261 RepID=A0A8S2F0A0_9BILA|nr:unnamed protein product [Didymodactylos carnosus]CAF4171625.1 unnamed protein product [Didymodactylos carnosus]
MYSREKCKNPTDGLTRGESAALSLREKYWTKPLFMSAFKKLLSVQDRVRRSVNVALGANYRLRDIVLKSVATRLTQAQVQNEYSSPVSATQVTNLLKYHRSLTRPSMYSVDDFRQWCLQRAAIPPIQSLQDVFLPIYEIISCDNLFVFFTRQLISLGALSRLLQVDATFKLN